MDHEERTRQLGIQPVGRLLLRLSIPAITASVVGAVYNIVNRIFVAQYLNEDAVAAVTASFPIFSIMLSAGMMISIGSSSLISIRLGEKKYEEAERIVGQALFLFILMSVGFLAFGLFFMNEMLQLLRTSPSVVPQAKQYITVLLFGAFFHEMSFGVNGFLRCEGRARTAMVTVLISAVLNIVFDYLFLAVLRTDIWGAGVATILAQLFSTGWVMFHYTSGKTLLRWRLKYIRWDTKLAEQVFMLGLPPFILQVLNCVLQTIQLNQLGLYGKLYGAAHGIENGDVIAVNVLGIFFVVGMMIYFPVLGLNQGAQPIVGYNIGAKQYKRVAKTLELSLIYGILFMGLSTFVIWVFPEMILRPFIKAGSPAERELFELGIHAARIFFAMLSAAGIVVIGSGYFQSNGMPKRAIAVTLVRQVFLLIPLLWFLPKWMEGMERFNGLDGLWYAVPISDFGSGVLAAYLVYREFKRLKHTEEESREFRTSRTFR
ncbi:MAG: MATE family efflux transporter [Planctomycetaceae bacterium]|jgi:putative MATE family efflux protein|nr:MATE family efflux transporter [Planctomycetaceae bacterium]